MSHRLICHPSKGKVPCLSNLSPKCRTASDNTVDGLTVNSVVQFTPVLHQKTWFPFSIKISCQSASQPINPRPQLFNHWSKLASNDSLRFRVWGRTTLSATNSTPARLCALWKSPAEGVAMAWVHEIMKTSGRPWLRRIPTLKSKEVSVWRTSPRRKVEPRQENKIHKDREQPMTRKIQKQRRARKQKQHLGKIEERALATQVGRQRPLGRRRATRRSGSNWQKVA